MGRRAIKGPFGRSIPQSEHGYPDDQLLTGGKYGKHRGTSRQRIKTMYEQRLINRYLDSRGRPTYHPASCDSEFAQVAEPSTVSVATTGQRARGMTNADAMENAGDFSPVPINSGSESGEPPDSAADTPPPAADKKTDMIYGQARTKGMIHKAQLNELKVLQQRGILVNKRGLSAPIIEAAATTRDRIMVVPDFISVDLYELARDNDDKQAGTHAVREALRAALRDALVSISDDGIGGLL